MTSPLRSALCGLAAPRRFVRAINPARALLATFTREQKALRMRARSRKLFESPSEPCPVVSVTVANFLARQKAEEKREEEGTEEEMEEKDFALNHIRDLEAEVEASEIEVARNELSRTAITSLSCRGCGVRLQAEAPSAPGYVEPRLAAEALSSGASPTATGLVCRRCLLLKFARPLKTRVAPVEAEELQKIFDSIRQLPRATILVVVDVLDIEGSCIPDLFSRLGPHHYVLVGNKVDQLLPDGPGYLTRWSAHLRDRALKLTGIDADRLASAFLISARTGYNIEPLITQLLAVKFRRQPTYIVGCANVGKSSLFNRLLNSDYCKESALVPTPEATVSAWPGTTASVLHFPVTTMTTTKEKLRQDRLAKASKHVTRELKNTIDPGFLRPLAGHVGRSFSHPVVLVDQHQGFMSLPTYRYELGDVVGSNLTEEIVEERFLRSRGHHEWQFSAQKMCSDTPGYVSEKQLANFLTAKENAAIQGGGKRRLLPRTFSLRPGLSLLLGGIARLDYCEGPQGLLLTTQTHLPVHITESQDLEAYLARFGAALKVPDLAAGPEERPAALPAMAEHEMTLSLSGGAVTSEADVVFSGVGWVAVTPPIGRRRLPNWREKDLTEQAVAAEPLEVRFRAHFPKDMPCLVRRPALCPRAVLQRGGRLPRLHEFHQPLYLQSWRGIGK